MKTEIHSPNKELLLSNLAERTKIDNIFAINPHENILFTIGDGHYFLERYNNKALLCGNIAQNHAKQNLGTLFEVTRQDMKEPIKAVPEPKAKTKE